MKSANRRLTLFRVAALLLAAVLAGGCSTTVQHSGFSQLTSAMQELREGTDRAIKHNEEISRERFILEVAEASLRDNGANAVTNLLIGSKPGEPFSWKMDELPLFMASRRFRAGVYALNSALIAYSELLSSLASPELISTAELEAEAQDLNAKLRAAVDMLGVNSSNEKLALFSTTAIEMARAYLERRRRSQLRKVLDENQPLIDQLAGRLQNAMGIAARSLRQDYEERSQRLAEDLLPGSSTALSDRTKAVRRLVDLDETYIRDLAILEALNASYGALPAAHRELRRAIVEPGASLASIEGILENGKRLSQLYEKLKADGDKQ
ncbi:MAG: hypothetical protein GXP47_03480 [Acidobacteria bacterium]|nr:hypothetical protein [Acidobacteriota bacterium]